MINLYEGITPNHTATHYVFSAFSSFLTMLEIYKLKEITPNNYTIDNLYIRCKLDETLTTSNYKNVTYIINTVDEVCYFVNSMKVQSGYVYFSISVDNWGTYLHKASLKDILIKRCNRKLSDNGIYDAIANTKDYEINNIEEITRTFSNLTVVLVVTAIGSSDTIKYPRLLSFTASELFKSGLIPSTWTWFFANFVDLGYYHVEGISGYGRMTIKKAYLIPNECISFSTKPCSVSNVSNPPETAQYNGYIPNQVIVNKSFEIDIDINKRYTIGGVDGHLPFINKTNNKVNPYFYFYYSLTDVKIGVTDGDAQQDISKSFEIPLYEKDEINATKEISSVLRYFMGLSQIGIGAYKGSPLSIVKGIGTLGNQIINDITPNPQPRGTNIINTGDCESSYGETETALYSPFKIYSALSLIDEEKHARKLGATFNEYVETITEIYNKELLGIGASTDDTYIQASIEVSNIPTDAITDITGKFNNGVNTQLL